MSEPTSRIQILAPERLDAFFKQYSDGQDYRMFREGLGRLLELCARYLASTPPGTHRVASIVPSHHDLTSIDWAIIQDPSPDGRGQHVLNGGLIYHGGTPPVWGIHT
jgi:hypothetical protein